MLIELKLEKPLSLPNQNFIIKRLKNANVIKTLFQCNEIVLHKNKIVLCFKTIVLITSDVKRY